MQESWEFEIIQPLDLPNPVYAEMIKDLVGQKAKEIAILLSYYFKSEGGLVEGVKLVDDINFTTETSGTLKVNFKLVHFNACLDIHGINSDQMVLNFNLDPMSKKIKFSGPLWVEREPDEL
jgi:hypothetical protein